MYNIVLQLFIFTFLYGIISADEYGTGFRTSSFRRSNQKERHLRSHPVRHSPELSALGEIPDFGKEFDKVKSQGEEQISKGVSGVTEAQKNMLTFWETYSNGIKDMTEKMKGVMGSFGVPKEFYDKEVEDGEDTVSKFSDSKKRDSISGTDTERDSYKKFSFADSE